MRSKNKTAALIIGMLLAALFLLPIAAVVCQSFMTPQQIERGGLQFLPAPFTLAPYWKILSASYEYLFMFWDSLKVTVLATTANLVASVCIGFFLGRFKFPGKKILLGMFFAVIFLPFSVTLVPNYMLIQQLGLFDSHWALILPAAFAPLGMILMMLCAAGLPDEVFEAAMLETGSVFQMLVRIIIPLLAPAIAAFVLLMFAENWNMVEQPQVMLDNMFKQPLSIALNSIYGSDASLKFSGAVIYILPVVFLHFLCEDAFMEELSSIGGGSNVKY